MTDALKTCPFCGGDADYERIQTGWWAVGCNEPDGLCFGYQTLTLFPTKKSAAAAWNTRTGTASPEPSIAQPHPGNTV